MLNGIADEETGLLDVIAAGQLWQVDDSPPLLMHQHGYHVALEYFFVAGGARALPMSDLPVRFARRFNNGPLGHGSPGQVACLWRVVDGSGLAAGRRRAKTHRIGA